MTRACTRAEALPHRYPFRIIDRTDGQVAVLASTNASRWNSASPSWLAEAMAQAAALLLTPQALAERPLEFRLAGLESLAWHLPPEAGMVLEFVVRETRWVGPVLRVVMEVEAEGKVRGSGGLLLVGSGIPLDAGAKGGTRTPTALRPQAPEACASTNSATFAAQAS